MSLNNLPILQLSNESYRVCVFYVIKYILRFGHSFLVKIQVLPSRISQLTGYKVCSNSERPCNRTNMHEFKQVVVCLYHLQEIYPVQHCRTCIERDRMCVIVCIAFIDMFLSSLS